VYAGKRAPETTPSPHFAISRLGTIMRPRPRDPREAGGILNPGCARGRDGQLYLFPRLVDGGNHSCIGIARVRFAAGGDPQGADRLGVALRPEAPYERMSASTYGCEDARVTYVPALDRYVMTYAAITPIGPRVALAVSDDLFAWRRLGLASFHPEHDLDLGVYNNKDPLLFPAPVRDPLGRLALALIHRPMYELTMRNMDVTVSLPTPCGVDDRRQSVWISYIDLDAARSDECALTRLAHHQRLAGPEFGWERIKIGGGAPPLLTHLGWLLVYHGVSGGPHLVTARDPGGRAVRYSAGAMVLDALDPRRIIYRSPEPILEPSTPEERTGAVANVVFPTGLDPRAAPAPGSRVDVYYGMADTAIGTGSLTLPETLPAQAA
jgi:beta-1,2-mannobiose phosphorylase / 1,2-beta-oligomannan phosphorylase